MARATFYDQIAANRRNSFLMAAFVVVLLGLLGFTIGFAVFGDPAGGMRRPALALVVGVLAGIGTYFAGDSLVLAVSGAREVDEASAPQLMNVVRELAIAANVPMPRGLPHRRHGAQRLRDRPRPEARVGRDHDRAAREARPRGAPGRHRATSSRTCATSTSGSR